MCFPRHRWLLPPHSQVRFVGDELRTQQIVSNLLTNATKFTDRGGRVTLVCSDVRVALNDRVMTWALRVEVHDTGIGMSPETVENMFSPFQQADGSITRRFGGTGLGLTIANLLAQRMGSTGIKVGLPFRQP